MAHPEPDLDRLPSAPVDKVVGPLQRFLHVEAASGVVLLVATLAALGLANSPLADGFLKFWKTEVGVSFGDWSFRHSLKHWINDGLMAVFFFVIGLEVKREIVMGELRELRKAALPLAAAVGGMVVPAGLYLAVQSGEPAAAGWGVPMATDIAFVVGCMALMGSRVPRGLRVLLLSLAIADDIGAILVIAIGYTDQLDLGMLGLAALGLGATWALAKLGVRSIGVYFVVGALVWFGFHESGVHATIAGVLLGLLTPSKSWVDETLFGRIVTGARGLLESGPAPAAAARRVAQAATESVSPLVRLETALHPWVGFVIMPVFALANAGVPVSADGFGHPVALAVVLGLAVGKPVGILLASVVAVKLRLASLPAGVGWGAVLGGGFLAGIGFTMALFIAGLALGGDELDPAKIGVLEGSALSGVAGMLVLLRVLPKRETPSG